MADHPIGKSLTLDTPTQGAVGTGDIIKSPTLDAVTQDAGTPAVSVYTYPTDPLSRSSGIKRTFWAGIGGQAVYQCELALGGTSTTYVSPIGSRDIPSAITPAKLPSGAGYQYSDYQAWLNSFASPQLIMIIFGGHMPSFGEWLAFKQAGRI